MDERGMGVELAAGAKLKDKHRDAWVEALGRLLNPGEQMVVLVRANLLRPMCDGLVITNARMAGFQSHDLGTKGYKVEVFADDLAAVDISRRRGSNCVVAQLRDGSEVNFGAVHEQDIELVVTAGGGCRRREPFGGAGCCRAASRG